MSVYLAWSEETKVDSLSSLISEFFVDPAVTSSILPSLCFILTVQLFYPSKELLSSLKSLVVANDIPGLDTALAKIDLPAETICSEEPTIDLSKRIFNRKRVIINYTLDYVVSVIKKDLKSSGDKGKYLLKFLEQTCNQISTKATVSLESLIDLLYEFKFKENRDYIKAVFIIFDDLDLVINPINVYACSHKVKKATALPLKSCSYQVIREQFLKDIKCSECEDQLKNESTIEKPLSVPDVSEEEDSKEFETINFTFDKSRPSPNNPKSQKKRAKPNNKAMRTLPDSRMLLSTSKKRDRLGSTQPSTDSKSKFYKDKVYESKDLLEISFIFDILDEQEACELMKALFCQNKEENDYIIPSVANRLVRLFVEYEKTFLLGIMFDFELEQDGDCHDSERSVSFITNAFKYSIFAKKSKISASIIRDYIDFLYKGKENLIEILLHFMNEYTESNGTLMYQSGIMNLEEILYHFEMMCTNFNFYQAEYFCRVFINLISKYNIDDTGIDADNLMVKEQLKLMSSTVDNHFLVWNENAVKICILVVYICKKLRKIHPELDIQAVTDIYSKIATKIINNCNSIHEVNDILTEKCINGYTALDLLAYEKMDTILENHKVGMIITDLWKGPYFRGNYLESSSSYQILSTCINKKKSFYGYLPNKVDEMKRKWFPSSLFTNKQFYSPFKFDIWKASMDIVYFVNGIIIIVLAFYIQMFFLDVMEKSVSLSPSMVEFQEIAAKMQDTSLSQSDLLTLQTRLAEIEVTLLPEAKVMREDTQYLIHFNLLLVSYFIQNLSQMLYAKLNGKKVIYLTPEVFVNFFSTYVSLYGFISWHADYTNISITPSKYYDLTVLNNFMNGAFLLKGMIYATLTVSLQWCRVFFILQANKTLGPYITIIIHMVGELLKFAIVYILIFVIFLCAGALLFFNRPEFADEWRGTLFLFSSMMGNFEFDTFSEDNSRIEKEYGWIYMILFVVMTNILLLNFLIAILSNKYTEMEQKSKVLYLQNILLMNQGQSNNEYYSSIVSSFVPLNILLLPAVPFVVLMKSKKLNTILLYICYAPFSVLAVTLYLISALIVTPLAYISLTTRCIKDIFNFKTRIRSDSTKTIQRITKNVSLILVGPFYLILLIFMDTVAFYLDLFQENSKNKHPIPFNDLKYNNVKLDPFIIQVLIDTIEQGESRIDTRSLIVHFRRKMRVIGQIKSILLQFKPREYDNDEEEEDPLSTFYHCQQFEIAHDFDTQFVTKHDPEYILKQYNVLKRLLIRNSIEEDMLTFSLNQSLNSLYKRSSTELSQVKKIDPHIAFKSKFKLGYIHRAAFMVFLASIKNKKQFMDHLSEDTPSLAANDSSKNDIDGMDYEYIEHKLASLRANRCHSSVKSVNNETENDTKPS
ncbi:unnamed protein product [Moneuplotes crassus]|uniref:Ion transport domain-containing protein n=1 Tax=Euplotes crassus TaxID=5936 RepID=A0AAD1Y9B0_EUPCR|nr:unnamed protein product [Moneuplotes crassus]